jgi:hypothetical protein
MTDIHAKFAALIRGTAFDWELWLLKDAEIICNC